MALPHVMYNVVKLPGQVAGFLGSAHDPFQVSADPNAADFRLGELELPGDVSLDRLDDRAALLQALDRQLRRTETEADREHPQVASRDVYTEKAFRLLHSPAVRRAFQLEEEDPRLRDRYGRTKHGQSVLLARRLVEAGVRFVTVYDGQHNGQLANWDAHENVFAPAQGRPAAAGRPGLRGPDRRPDRPRPARLDAGHRHGRVRPHPEDQRQRAAATTGPTATASSWPAAACRGGTVFGASDKLGAYPETDAVTPGDLAATLFWRFGLDPTAEMLDLTGRPYKRAEGQAIRGGVRVGQRCPPALCWFSVNGKSGVAR